ncbi:hypothetical protein GQ600_9540 [Phytophthora cactorum]|nr:hypothetical protein GQ600_9540 [Phytophthora cactorum]
MSVYTKFAIIGAGGIGGTIGTSCSRRAPPFPSSLVTTLSRPYRPSRRVVPSFSRSCTVTRTPSRRRWPAVKCHQRRIALPLDVQPPVVRAAKAAGIQLFVPAEYGVKVTEGPNAYKKVVQDLLAEVQLPATIFYTDAGTF